MRWGWVILFVCIGLSGCSVRQSAPAPEITPPPVAQAYDGAVTASLVTESELVANSPRLDLSREQRAAGAYAGYEETVYSFYYLYMDDRQLSYGTCNGTRSYDRFERSATTHRVGVTYR